MHIRAMTSHPTPLAKWMIDNGQNDASMAAAVTGAGGKVTRSQINRLRNGTSKPSWASAAALERLTGIPAGELFATAADNASPDQQAAA